jgi:hypothetical protein
MFTLSVGDVKTGDPANFSIFKQIQFMLSTNTSAFGGGKSGQWNNETALKHDMTLFLFSFSFPLFFVLGNYYLITRILHSTQTASWLAED